MNRNPILPGVPEVPEVPADQITIPLPPISAAERSEGLLRLPHAQSDTKSYRNQVIRIWPDGPEAKAVDLVTTADPTVGPDTLFGPDCGPVYLVAGTHSFGRLTNRDDDLRAVRRMRSELPPHGGQRRLSAPDWRP